MSSISDKTRKILWGRSGNRCAICKRELVIDATSQDDEAVVGDECHIISPQTNGPRHDPTFQKDKLDLYENLLLLCRTHHKMVDDQEITFTPDILRQVKSNHEAWISEKLTEQPKLKPLRIRRVKQNTPSFLVRLTTGKDILDVVSNVYALSMDHDELRSRDEVDVVGRFVQEVNDWSEISDEIELGALISAAYELTQLLKLVEEKGFFVFGGCETRILEGGNSETPSSWPVGILYVLRKDNDAIISTANDA